QAHSDKISLTLSLTPHIRSDHMVSSLIIPHGKGVHSLLPACIAMKEKNPLMAVFFCVDFLCNQLITVFCLLCQLLSVGVPGPLLSILPGFLILLLYIICMYQGIHTFLGDPGKCLQPFHKRRHQGRTY